MFHLSIPHRLFQVSTRKRQRVLGLATQRSKFGKKIIPLSTFSRVIVKGIVFESPVLKLTCGFKSFLFQRVYYGFTKGQGKKQDQRGNVVSTK